MSVKEALKALFFYCRGEKVRCLSLYNLRCKCCFFISFLYRNVYSVYKGEILSERGTEIPWILKHIRKKRKKDKILLLGVCESLFSVYLATSFDDVYGVDIHKYNEKHPNLNVLCADIMNLPFNANTFDVVIAISTIEHVGIGVYGDPLSERGDYIALKEIKKVLSDDGVALITLPAARDYKVEKIERVYSPQELENLFSIFPKATYAFFFKKRSIFRVSMSVEDVNRKRYKGERGLVCVKVNGK